MLQTVVSPLHALSLPCNSSRQKAAGATQTRCRQLPGMKSFLGYVSQTSSPAEGCSVFMLPGGCHGSMLGCQLGQTRGQLSAPGYGAHRDRALAIAGGERKLRFLCLQQHSDPPPNLGLPRDLTEAEVPLWNKSKRVMGVPGAQPPAFLLSAVDMTHQRDELLKGVTALLALPAHTHPLNYCLIFIPLQ